MSDSLPLRVCPHLPRVDLSWDRLDAFDRAEEWAMFSVAGPLERFRPGRVRLGWRDGALFIHATLPDADVFTFATGDHQPFWKLGDVFEIFFRDAAREDYWELHITPTGQRGQLRFSSAGCIRAIRAGEGRLEDYYVTEPAFDFQARVNADGWEVLARVPWPGLGEALVSFSRYDHDRALAEPVLSSTSRHEEVNFHRQEDWSRIVPA